MSGAQQNQITLIGNLTDDPELKFTPSGAAVTNFTVAHTNRRYNKETDTWDDGDTSYYRVAAWRNLAENVAETLVKGTRVIVVGLLSVRQFERQDGSKGSSTEINANFIGPDLTWATATIQKANRSHNGGGEATQNPWAQNEATPQGQNPWASPADNPQPATAGTTPAAEPPF